MAGTKFLLFTALAAALLSGQAVAGGDAERGRSLSVQCVACHGPQGISPNPMFPHIAGQNSAYLEIQLRDFRSGERYHPVMSPIAKALSVRDIHDLAAYYGMVPQLFGQARPTATPLPHESEE